MREEKNSKNPGMKILGWPRPEKSQDPINPGMKILGQSRPEKSRDPRIFWDGINLLFSSLYWWDPGIFRDGISQTFSSQDFLEKLG